MDYSVEGYLRRLNLMQLRMVCEMPEKKVIPEIREMALKILAEKEKRNNAQKTSP